MSINKKLSPILASRNSDIGNSADFPISVNQIDYPISVIRLVDTTRSGDRRCIGNVNYVVQNGD